MTREPFDQDRPHGVGALDAESLERLREGERPGLNPEAVLACLAGMAIVLGFAAVAIAIGIRLTDYLASL